MELIYMYIKNFGHKVGDSDNEQFIMNKEFNFSDRFNVKYDLEKEELHISKTKELCPDFYGKSVKNVKMIVGQNGSGKTTMMDILGMNRNDRFDQSFVRQYKSQGIQGKLGFHKPGDDISYFKDEYIIIYLIKEADDLSECIFGMEVIGNFYEGGFIKNLVPEKDTFYKLPIGFTFKYKDREICANGFHFFNYIDSESNKLVYNSPLGRKYLNMICEDCRIFYLSNSYSSRIKYKKTRVFKDIDKEDEEYLMKRFYRKLDMENSSDYESAYELLKDEKYDDFRERILKFSPEIILSNNFMEREVLPTIKYEEIRIDENYRKLIKYLRTELVTRNQENKKQEVLLKWIDDYIMDQFTALLEGSFSKENIKSTLDKELSTIEQDIEVVNIDTKIIESSDERLLMDTSSINEKIKNIYDEFIYMIAATKKICEYSLEIDKHNKMLKEFFDEDSEEKIGNFEWQVYSKLLVSRYVLSRLSLKYEMIREGVYQSSFEDIIKKLMKLDIECFTGNKTICLTSEGQDKGVVRAIFKTMKKYSKIDYCDVERNFLFYLTVLSEGERAVFAIFSKVIALLNDGKNSSLNIFLLDEPDVHLHPQWAKEFMNCLFIAIDIFSEELTHLNTQFIIATHSPFLLSDVRKEDVILLQYEDGIRPNGHTLKSQGQEFETFAANIHTMLSNSFFMKSTIGEFAYKKIKDVVKDLTEKSKDELLNDRVEEIQYIIKNIGEPLIKRKLQNMFNSLFPEGIEDYKRKIEELEKEKILLQKALRDKELDNIDGIMKLLNEKIRELRYKAGEGI